MENKKILSGIYMIEYRWDLVFLHSTFNKVDETLKLDKFKVLLLQTFDIDRINKIVEVLLDQNKLLIDFDKEIVKLIQPKEQKFENSMLYYFNADNIQREIEEEEYDIYNTSSLNQIL